MSYYPTMDEDLQRAREILERGKASPAKASGGWYGYPAGTPYEGATIYGADTYAAYKLIESFVGEIERLREKQTRLADIFWRFDVASPTALETLLERLKGHEAERPHLQQQILDQQGRAEKAEQLLQVVANAYEGRGPLPADLKEHGMVERALFFRVGIKTRSGDAP